MTVAELLAASRAWHERYRHASGTIDSHGRVAAPPRISEAGAFVLEALRLRTDAHALDPDQTSPAWSIDRAVNKGQPSDRLVDFYVSYLAS